MGEIRTIRVEAMTRVEGEGSLHIRLSDGKIEQVQLSIFEPPRLFEAFLRGRALEEVPDITARICGICPVAYQMSSVHALESALGVQVSEELRRLRRLLYCGEWIESHALHVHMLHAPDFLGYDKRAGDGQGFSRGGQPRLAAQEARQPTARRAGRPGRASRQRGRRRILSPAAARRAGRAGAGLRVGIASGHRDDPLGGQLRLSPVRAALRFRGPVASRRVRHVRGHDSLKRRPGDRRIAIRRTLPRAAGSPFHRLAGRAPRHGPNVFPGALGARQSQSRTTAAHGSAFGRRGRPGTPLPQRVQEHRGPRHRDRAGLRRSAGDSQGLSAVEARAASSTTTRQPRARRPPKRPADCSITATKSTPKGW